jgi:predicted  nucleic acid-binding Zn-ribbon protein
MAGTTDPIEMVTVSDENIAVEEQLSRKNGGWVISFTLTSKRDRSIAVRISVPMPDEPTRQDVGFHPRHEPQTWGIRDGILTFEDTVPSDEPLQILLGIVLVEDVTLSLSEPRIDLSQPIESAEDEEMPSEEAPLFRSNSVDVADEPSAPSGPAPSNDGPVDQHDPADSPADLDEEAVTSDSQAAPSIDEGPSLEEAFDLDHLEEISESIEELPEDNMGVNSEESAETEPSRPDDGVFGDFESATDDEEEAVVETAEEPTLSAEQAPETDHDDVLTKLVEQLESSDPEDDAVEALREQLRPESQKSMDVRMQHIQSRMDDLDAYTEALEGLINEHGTASEFMSKIETELDDLSAEIEAVRSETAAADNDRQEIRNRLSGVESSIEEVDDDLRARLDNMYEELDSIRESIGDQDEQVEALRETVYDNDEELEHLDDRIESTETQLEDHRDALDQRLSTLSNQLNDLQDTFESDLGRLQDEVESLSEMRSVFAQAFAGQGLEEAVSDEDETENLWDDEDAVE